MADTAIFSATNKLGDLLIEKAATFPQGVGEQVKSLKDELQRMQCCLTDALQKQTDDERIRKWVSEIREFAQDAENFIDTFILEDEPVPRKSKSGLMGKWLHSSSHSSRIDRMRSKLRDLDKRRAKYGIQNLDERLDKEDVEWRGRFSLRQKDTQLVGMDKEIELLLQEVILNERKGLSVAGIVGLRGAGKSTLAGKLYGHAAVADRFERRVWVAVSREFSPKDVMVEIMVQLMDPSENKMKEAEGLEKLTLESLQQIFVDECLQESRYLIVLDGVWEEAQWESLAGVFPGEDKGSRLLLTSCNRGITKQAGYIHEMKPLDSNESWELLLKSTFIEGTNVKCPEDLYSIGREILKNCDGLPLAITLVGGLLADKNPSKSKWKKVLKEINSHLGKRSDSSVSTILELSYRNLSPRLKSCFLCLGFFKKDITIRAKKLVRIWIAQGLIQDEQGEKTLEELGQSYLNELINRNMVQVKDKAKDGSVKSCRVHDLVHELSITKAKEEIGFEIIHSEGMNNSSRVSSDKPCHLAIYSINKSFVTRSKDQNKHLRSLSFQSIRLGCNVDIMSCVHPSYWESFQLLKILNFEDLPLENLPDTIGSLIRLKYLGLRNTRIKNLPPSLGRLKSLEVIDVTKSNYGIEVENVIWELKNLRHLHGDGSIYCKGPLKIDTLKNLQTLSYVVADEDFVPEHLTNMTNLRTLGLFFIFINEDYFDELCSRLYPSLAVMENLLSLNLRWSPFERLMMYSLGGLANLHRLTQLKLDGRITSLPNACEFPPNLSCLTLLRTSHNEDPMPVLEKLQKLMYLKLETAYSGDQDMVISEKGFPRLEVLVLRKMWNLKNIQAARGAIPMLKRLEIYRCDESLATNLPDELRLVTTRIS